MKKAQWLFWGKLIIGCLIVIVASHQINQRESILDALEQADWLYIFLAFVLLFFNVALAYIKWLYLVRLALPDAAHSQVAGSLFLGFALGMITPGRLGELGRGLYFEAEGRATITGLNVIDKMANQVVFLTLGTFALTVMWISDLADIAWLTVPSLLAVVVVWLLILSRGITGGILRWVSSKLAVGSWFRQLIAAYDLLSVKRSFILVFWSILWTGIISLQYHLLVKAFTSVTIASSLQSVPATLYAKTLLPLTFGDLGIRESIAVFFYGLFNVSSAAVFNASLCIFFINFLFPALIGIYFVFYLRPGFAGEISDKSIRQN